MGSIETLDDGQRAVLQLLLRQGKSYDEIAGLLHTDAGAVRRRAHAAVEALGPDGPGVSSDGRHEIADYLLGQQTASQRAATREYLEGSSAGRDWALAAVAGLAPLAGGHRLPDIPDERGRPAGPPDRGTAPQAGAQPSSQLGGRLIAAGLGLVVAIVIILVVSLTGGGDSGGGGQRAATTPIPTTTTAAGTLGGNPLVLLEGTLRPPKGSGSTSRGQVAIISFPESKRYRLALEASKLPPSSARDSAYGVWLYTSPAQAQFLGFPDKAVGRDGKLATVADLSPDTPQYRQVLLTSERTTAAPTKPGTVVLRARLARTSAQRQAKP
jgi:hypothetical protein